MTNSKNSNEKNIATAGLSRQPLRSTGRSVRRIERTNYEVMAICKRRPRPRQGGRFPGSHVFGKRRSSDYGDNPAVPICILKEKRQRRDGAILFESFAALLLVLFIQPLPDRHLYEQTQIGVMQ